jgi:hypothetical protein
MSDTTTSSESRRANSKRPHTQPQFQFYLRPSTASGASAAPQAVLGWFSRAGNQVAHQSRAEDDRTRVG